MREGVKFGKGVILSATIKLTLTVQTPVARRLNKAIHWINHYTVDNPIRFVITYPPDSDLSFGKSNPTFIQLGPVGH